MIEKGECDFVDDIAVELPLRMIADMLGVPQDDRRQLFEWTNTLSRAAATADPQLGMGALMEIGGYMNGLTAERKANPGDDLVSRMITAEVDGESLSEAEVTFFFGILMFAGNDTTRNTASGGMRALIENDGRAPKAGQQSGRNPERRRRDAAVGDTGHLLHSRRPVRHRSRRTPDPRG